MATWAHHVDPVAGVLSEPEVSRRIEGHPRRLAIAELPWQVALHYVSFGIDGCDGVAGPLRKPEAAVLSDGAFPAESAGGQLEFGQLAPLQASYPVGADPKGSTRRRPERR